jgi:hypothetical protein
MILTADAFAWWPTFARGRRMWDSKRLAVSDSLPGAHVPPDSAPPARLGSLGVGGTHTQRTKAIYQVIGKFRHQAHLVFGERIRLSANNLWQSRDGGAGKVVDRGAVGGVPGYTLYGRATDKRNIFWTVRGNSLAVALEPGY